MPRPIALLCFSLLCLPLLAQEPSPNPQGGLKQRTDSSLDKGVYQVDPGTHFLLNMINSVSTKQALVGDPLYLETAFPILVNGHIVVPQGSWVKGTVTEVKRPGRVKGRGELQVRFDSLTLPNGVTRNFRADIGALDARADEKLNRENGKIKGPGDKKGDAETIAGTTIAGTAAGSGIGGLAGNASKGAGIGTVSGLAVGLVGVLMTRGPDATLTKGSTVEMVMDRPLTFTDADLNFSNVPPRAALSEGTPAQPAKSRGFGRFPF